MEEKKRCSWCESSLITKKYHDEEWGIPLHDDRKHFEYLTLEVMQCGLNWTMILKKRETLKKCFDNFDFEKIALYDEAKINSIMEVDNMIKSQRKIRAIINNARLYKDIVNEYGSFDKYLWGYTNNKTYIYKSHKYESQNSNELSDKICRDLKKRGFKFLGSITIYAHLQACGIINDHSDECFMFDYINSNFPIEVIDM